jgi:hypothetical protein
VEFALPVMAQVLKYLNPYPQTPSPACDGSGLPIHTHTQTNTLYIFKYMYILAVMAQASPYIYIYIYTGAEKGSTTRTCPTCRGTGEVLQTAMGFFQVKTRSTIKKNCRGTGEVLQMSLFLVGVADVAGFHRVLVPCAFVIYVCLHLICVWVCVWVFVFVCVCVCMCVCSSPSLSRARSLSVCVCGGRVARSTGFGAVSDLQRRGQDY